ncbi:conserved hypothetical protein [Ricinus communis]|uniref:Uncharacterized protein n=1 Tax=Ricinus communis TaxID=3988 RepID=B9T0G0_RICCO|nr:conserved hypothetical protein [Ricinus communis]
MEERTPVAQPPIQERLVNQPSLEDFANLLESHERISESIKDLFSIQTLSPLPNNGRSTTEQRHNLSMSRAVTQ